jgi:DNA-binding CsgD family transcriptional regulator
VEAILPSKRTPPTLDPSSPLTDRQSEVYRLVARGLTNKEIGHSLGISERGVAAQVSRLLTKFGVPNRAGLIARVMSDALHDGTPRTATLHELTRDLMRECEAYRDSPFMVGLTLGPENVVVFVNEASKRINGIGLEAADSEQFVRRRARSGTHAWVEASKKVFRTGLPLSIESATASWERDDGTEQSGTLTCVLQPMRRDQDVVGVLWICVPEASG